MSPFRCRRPGTLALGWQVNPALGGEDMLALPRETCHVKADGSRVINPPAFSEAVEATQAKE